MYVCLLSINQLVSVYFFIPISPTFVSLSLSLSHQFRASTLYICYLILSINYFLHLFSISINYLAKSLSVSHKLARLLTSVIFLSLSLDVSNHSVCVLSRFIKWLFLSFCSLRQPLILSVTRSLSFLHWTSLYVSFVKSSLAYKLFCFVVSNLYLSVPVYFHFQSGSTYLTGLLIIFSSSLRFTEVSLLLHWGSNLGWPRRMLPLWCAFGRPNQQFCHLQLSLSLSDFSLPLCLDSQCLFWQSLRRRRRRRRRTTLGSHTICWLRRGGVSHWLLVIYFTAHEQRFTGWGTKLWDRKIQEKVFSSQRQKMEGSSWPEFRERKYQINRAWEKESVIGWDVYTRGIALSPHTTSSPFLKPKYSTTFVFKFS